MYSSSLQSFTKINLKLKGYLIYQQNLILSQDDDSSNSWVDIGFPLYILLFFFIAAHFCKSGYLYEKLNFWRAYMKIQALHQNIFV